MSFIVPEPLEAYAAAHSEPLPAYFAEIEAYTQAHTEAPQMLTGPLEAAFLRLLVGLLGAKRVLEIGTFTGYSALAMAEALPEEGELITCELNPRTAEAARAHFGQVAAGRRIHLREGPALETLRTLTGPFDLVFLDADKENYLRYYEAVLPLLRPGGLIAADNTLWSGRVLEPKAQTDLALVAFNEAVAKDPRVEKVMVTLRDGVTLIRKR
jgi:caffeoyl-CoA O-methyltransferase